MVSSDSSDSEEEDENRIDHQPEESSDNETSGQVRDFGKLRFSMALPNYT